MPHSGAVPPVLARPVALSAADWPPPVIPPPGLPGWPGLPGVRVHQGYWGCRGHRGHRGHQDLQESWTLRSPSRRRHPLRMRVHRSPPLPEQPVIERSICAGSDADSREAQSPLPLQDVSPFARPTCTFAGSLVGESPPFVHSGRSRSEPSIPGSTTTLSTICA